MPRATDALVLQERARIARELHDSVGQTLYAIGLSASQALRLVDQDEKNTVQDLLKDVLQLAKAGQAELRMLVANIRADPCTAGGLVEGLSQLASEDPERIVYVRGDRTISYAQLMDALGIVNTAGFTKVTLLAEGAKPQ